MQSDVQGVYFVGKWYNKWTQQFKFLKHVVYRIPKDFVTDAIVFACLLNWKDYSQLQLTPVKAENSIQFSFGIHFSFKVKMLQKIKAINIYPNNAIQINPCVDNVCTISIDCDHNCSKIHLWQLLNWNLDNYFKFYLCGVWFFLIFFFGRHTSAAADVSAPSKTRLVSRVFAFFFYANSQYKKIKNKKPKTKKIKKIQKKKKQ